MIKSITAAALAIAALAGPAHAEIVAAWCVLSWTDGSKPAKKGVCDFTQTSGDVQVWMGDYEFYFRANDQGVGYQRQNNQGHILFKRGDYVLKVVQG
ncbi:MULTISPECIES: hypothetical protein [unclassified Synechococcus]|uniref:hypothetical protein n=1 Tax=unclassified Synechococcus TaxID=2626047 RepID=UPI000833D28F|nr:MULTISPECIES: hypothetical protein [unclassified Synechococcus]